MEFKPDFKKQGKVSEEKTEDQLINEMYADLKPIEGYKLKTQEELQSGWDAKKAAESAKFDKLNVHQTEMFDEKTEE
jgi:hypothetical protein